MTSTNTFTVKFARNFQKTASTFRPDLDENKQTEAVSASAAAARLEQLGQWKRENTVVGFFNIEDSNVTTTGSGDALAAPSCGQSASASLQCNLRHILLMSVAEAFDFRKKKIQATIVQETHVRAASPTAKAKELREMVLRRRLSEMEAHRMLLETQQYFAILAEDVENVFKRLHPAQWATDLDQALVKTFRHCRKQFHCLQLWATNPRREGQATARPAQVPQGSRSPSPEKQQQQQSAHAVAPAAPVSQA